MTTWPPKTARWCQRTILKNYGKEWLSFMTVSSLRNIQLKPPPKKKFLSGRFLRIRRPIQRSLSKHLGSAAAPGSILAPENKTKAFTPLWRRAVFLLNLRPLPSLWTWTLLTAPIAEIITPNLLQLNAYVWTSMLYSFGKPKSFNLQKDS